MNLPVEILRKVAKNLVAEGDIAAAALVSWEWYASFTPVLYRHVEIAEARFLEDENGPDLRQISGLGLVSALHRNPYLSSLVLSITHKFVIGIRVRISKKQVRMWETGLRKMRFQLQEIVDRNGFPRVKELRLGDPDIETAGLLLRGLYPQLEFLSLATAYVQFLPFGRLARLPSRLKELGLEVLENSIHDPEQSLYGDTWHAMGLEPRKAYDIIHVDINTFLASSTSLQILRVTGVEMLDTVLEGITLPHLHSLEVDRSYNSLVDQSVTCLASFLDRHLSISRLALRGLPDHGGAISSISRAASAGIHELVSSIEGATDDYFTFLRKFTGLKAFKLECDFFGDFRQFLLTDLVKVIGHLHRGGLGVKRLALPMPLDLSGWPGPTRVEVRPARDLLSDFGMVFKDYLPEVEVLGIIQVGEFEDFGAAEWAQALAGHPSLRKLSIKTALLSNSSVGSKTLQEVVDEIAQQFSALPQLEQLVFSKEEPSGDPVQVLIVRGELGVSGKASNVDRSMVDAEFFDPFFQDTWTSID